MVFIGSGTAVQKCLLNLYLIERVKVINVCITFLMFHIGFEYNFRIRIQVFWRPYFLFLMGVMPEIL